MTELINPDETIAVPEGVLADLRKFIRRMSEETVDIKQLGIVGKTKEQILGELDKIYQI